MSEPTETKDHGHSGESLIEKISEKIHAHDSSSSSSDSESEPEVVKKPESESSTKDKIFRIFGRERPVHQVFGGGKPADVLLWRNKKLSAGFLGGVTGAWVFFELLEYHLLTLICHVLIVALAILFLYSNAHTLLQKKEPKVPEVKIPEGPFIQVVSALTTEVNRALAVLRSIASGKDLKKFLIIIAGLWVFSIVGSWCNFLTMFYITVVLLHSVPVLYEKYEDKIDPAAEKGLNEFKKQYAVFDEKVVSKVLSKIPKGLKDKKAA